MSTAAAATLRTDAKVIGLVGAAHMLSHFALLAVPSLFFLIKDDFGVGFTALGFAVSMLFATSGVFQTPAGFLVDRLGGKTVLVGGMAFVSLGLALAGLAQSYAMLVAALMVLGFGNSVFHPADLAILNARVDAKRLGPAFSIHAVSGNIGFAIAPVFSVGVAAAFGWRWALFAAAAIGFALTALLASQRALRGEAPAGVQRDAGGQGLGAALRLLASVPVLACFTFFVFSAIASGGIQIFAIPAMVSLYGVDPVVASATLSGFLVGVAAGTMLGGIAAAKTHHHGLTAAGGMAAALLLVVLLASGALPPGLLLVAMTLTGASLGIVYPSRDVVVRAAAPASGFGKVYGFVYSGLDLGVSVGPPIAGWFLDRGEPRLVFLVSAAALLLAVLTMAWLGRRRG